MINTRFLGIHAAAWIVGTVPAWGVSSALAEHRVEDSCARTYTTVRYATAYPATTIVYEEPVRYYAPTRTYARASYYRPSRHYGRSHYSSSYSRHGHGSTRYYRSARRYAGKVYRYLRHNARSHRTGYSRGHRGSSFGVNYSRGHHGRSYGISFSRGHRGRSFSLGFSRGHSGHRGRSLRFGFSRRHHRR